MQLKSRVVGCPASGCAAAFAVRAERLGHNVQCPVCRTRLTARPLAVVRRLAARPEAAARVAPSALLRLPLAVLVDNVRSLWNVGSIFRTSDACGVRTLVLCGITGHPPRPEIAKTALGAEELVDWRYGADPLEVLGRLVAEGYTPVAVETSSAAVSLEEFDWPERVCLVVGNEVAGISPSVLERCPSHVRIPMRGLKGSFNVAVAFGIAAYAAARTLAARGAATLAAMALSLGLAVADSAALPLTIEHVWFHVPRGQVLFNIVNTAGDLTITEHGISFSTRQKTEEIPLERIQLISYGKIKGNVDTDWALLGIGDERVDSIVGIRDGRKFGYGQKSWEIYEQIKSALAGLGAAQYRVPQGLRIFDDFDLQFTLAIPEAWQAYLESLVIVGERAPWGTIVFSSAPIRLPGAAGDGKPAIDRSLLAEVLAGSVPAFFVERRQVEKGMRCDGFTEKGLERLLQLAAEGRLFLGGGRLAESPAVTPELIDRCKGLRLRARSVSTAGVETALDLHTAADRDTLFVFGVRASPETYEESRKALEAALSTLKFSIAQ